MNLARNIFICGCMAFISASLGFSVWAHTNVSVIQAVTLGCLLMMVQVALYLFIWKTIVYDTLSERINEITFKEAENGQQLERVFVALQKIRESLRDVAREENKAITEELEVLSGVVTQIADGHMELETRLDGLAEQIASRPVARPHAQPEAVRAASAPAHFDFDALEPDIGSAVLEEEPEPTLPPNPLIERAIHGAIKRNAIDVFLQPIVTLPQRKTKFYSAVSSLKLLSGDSVGHSAYVPYAEQQGNMPVLDKILLIRTIQILRRLLERKPDAIVICAISGAGLADGSFFPDFRKLLNTRSDLVNHLIFEFDQQAILKRSALEEESLKALKDLGFMFTMNNVTTLSMDYRGLSALGFHYVKVPVNTLMSATEHGVSDIHAEDFSRFAARHGIQVIVEEITRESEVIELQDYSVSLAQGDLFGAPREVRNDPPRPQSAAV